MSKLVQLRELRNTLSKDANTINSKYAADARMTAEDGGKIDTILAQIEAIDADISRENRRAQLAVETPEAQHEAALNAATKDP